MIKEKLKYWVFVYVKGKTKILEKLKYWVCVYVKGKTKILGVCIC